MVVGKGRNIYLQVIIMKFPHCMLLQVPVHLPTFLLSQLVKLVSEFPGLHQPLGPL